MALLLPSSLTATIGSTNGKGRGISHLRLSVFIYPLAYVCASRSARLCIGTCTNVHKSMHFCAEHDAQKCQRRTFYKRPQISCADNEKHKKLILASSPSGSSLHGTIAREESSSWSSTFSCFWVNHLKMFALLFENIITFARVL